jgi:hypothetical protein
MTAEQIVGLLRQAEVELAQGRTVGEVCRGLGVPGASLLLADGVWRAEGRPGLQIKGWGHRTERARERAAEAG